MKQASSFFIFLGIVCSLISSYFIWQRYSPARLSFNTVSAHAKISTSQTIPTQLKIKNLNILLPIVPAQVSNNTWQATTGGISFLKTSPIPGEKGNSILYGHNFPSLLGNLPKIKTGDEIEITLNNKTKKLFIVEFTTIVTPDETYILDQTSDRRITLYTCTGFLDTKRYIVIALLKT